MSAARELSGDQRGAIMLTGLFMACFLIGSLWFLIGIGDTIVFRDRMQEAADHGAFTASALQAKGMNFISLCNLILLVGVTIHIILGIIHDIALAICIASYGFGCGFWVAERKIYTGYFKVLKPAAEAIHVAEVAASTSYPVLASIEGLQVGKKYDSQGTTVTVVPLSRSLIPAERGKTGLLPVQAQPFGYLCAKIVNTGFTALFNQAIGISNHGVSGTVLDIVKVIIGGVVELRYCGGSFSGASTSFSKKVGEGNGQIDAENEKIEKDSSSNKTSVDKVDTGIGGGSLDPGFDSFWGKDGPLTVIYQAKNGNAYFQTYSMNISPKYDDDSESKVGIARGTKTGLSKYTKREPTVGYFAQSEFYFDCKEKWFDLDCNYEDNATFAIKWRARLRRFDIPGATALLGGAGPGLISSIQGSGVFSSLPGDVAASARKTLGTSGMLGATSLGAFTSVFQQAQAGSSAVGAVAKPPVFGVFH